MTLTAEQAEHRAHEDVKRALEYAKQSLLKAVQELEQMEAQLEKDNPAQKPRTMNWIVMSLSGHLTKSLDIERLADAQAMLLLAAYLKEQESKND